LPRSGDNGAPRVAYQGRPGAFSEDAARTLVANAETRGFETFDELVAAVDSGAVEYGCLPVENAISGSIPRSYDLLSQHPRVGVVGELIYEVVQNLVAIPGTTFADVREVRSHAVALEQVRAYIDAHQWSRTVVADTAGAVADMMRVGDRSVVAVASALAAERYGAQILAPAIHDDPENFTRFFLLTAGRHPEERVSRACVALDLQNAPGTLRDALAAFADRGINLRCLVARPTHAKAFRYRFYVELEGADDRRLTAALADIDGTARILGRY
jgi:prephenate dehydratase